jgi:hypothetical protein
VFGRTRAKGVLMPLDLDPTPDGNALLHDDGTIDVLGPMELLIHDHAAAPLRLPHHAHCPDVELFHKS